ncbi:putative GPI anchored cell wall protein [Aspergillus ruber CBS 135680]|uniref:GPI anchored cell wall protein n=1 Tax=Aspergillus ruber (strain CBS 135680) TaxID=1388766 RepID=A0A017S5C7_ASPRC|nr:GPI anchored cell wall protein [Aspergillus ruber CBS 135680]EYE92238.1 GPI anchored cell wall protein [Aspergillus ruber CBS 135680]
MKNFVTVAAFAAGANALVGRSNSCCFSLNASGGASGTLGQLSDGQNRIGDDSLSPAQYCIDSNGAITDGNGRGCILTPPTTQFQCDEGATPTPGFSINSEGQLEYKGNTKFVACETGQNDGLNVYTEESDAVTQCQDVTLAADSCSGSGSGSGSGPSSSASPSSPAPRPTSSVPVGSASTPAGSSPSGEAPVVIPVSSAPGSSKPKTTVWTTVTSYDCSTTPGVPVETPSGPQSQTVSGTPGVPGGSQPSGTPGVPGGSQPSGTTPVPSGTASVPGGSQPSESAQPSGTASSSQPSGTSTGSQPSGSASGSCPTNLNGEYTAPHLIIPVDSSSPDNAPGTSFNGTISSDKTTLYNFDVPQSYADKTCSLVFLFPKQEDLETSAFTFSGDGKIDFASLESAVTTDTSYSNMPSVKEDYGVTTVAPGNSYVISTFSCPAGEAVSYEMKNSGSTYLDFFEDYNPSPIGLYITTC